MSDDTGGFGAAPPPPPPPPSAGGGGTLPQRGLGDILTAAWGVYKANAAKLIGIVAIVVVPLALLGALVTKVAFASNCDTVTGFGNTSIKVCEPRSWFVVLTGSVIGIALAFIMSFVVQAAIARAAGLATVGDPVDTGESYRWGFRHLGSVLLISLLAGLIIFGGLLLLIIPGIIFAIFLTVVIPALLFESKRGTEAISRSWNLVRGHFWHVLGVVIVTGIITGLVSGIFTAIGGSNWFFSWIMDSIGRIITVPFSALVTVILYLDLRARSEALTGDQVRSELASNE
jgi:hypothetical protein